MILHLNGTIDSEQVDKLIEAVNKHQKKKYIEKITIYFRSEGGDTEAMTALVSIINNNKDIINLIGYGILYSSGFLIFFSSKCERSLLPGTVGMCHYTRVGVEISDNSKGYYSGDKANQIWIKEQNKWTVKFCIELGMTVKEISLIKKTEEVYFQTPRLQELLVNSINAG